LLLVFLFYCQRRQELLCLCIQSTHGARRWWREAPLQSNLFHLAEDGGGWHRHGRDAARSSRLRRVAGRITECPAPGVSLFDTRRWRLLSCLHGVDVGAVHPRQHTSAGTVDSRTLPLATLGSDQLRVSSATYKMPRYIRNWTVLT
jgi:hypothetical protein